MERPDGSAGALGRDESAGVVGDPAHRSAGSTLGCGDPVEAEDIVIAERLREPLADDGARTTLADAEASFGIDLDELRPHPGPIASSG